MQFILDLDWHSSSHDGPVKNGMCFQNDFRLSQGDLPLNHMMMGEMWARKRASILETHISPFTTLQRQTDLEQGGGPTNYKGAYKLF